MPPRPVASTLRWLAALLLVVVSAVLLGTFVPRPLWLSDESESATIRILVLRNPIHTDIAIPLDPEVRSRFAFLQEAGVPVSHPEAEWLIVGWGGRAFYLETPTWSDLKPGPVLKALTLDKSVMHVDVAGEIALPHPAVAAFEIGPAAFERLTTFVDTSFQRVDDETLLIAGSSYGPTDRFFEAKGSFNALVGCNTWTARALREAGLQTGWWSPLPANLFTSLALYN